jgi:CubicO group peptidase (beta-lactamase class C family)
MARAGPSRALWLLVVLVYDGLVGSTAPGGASGAPKLQSQAATRSGAEGDLPMRTRKRTNRYMDPLYLIGQAPIPGLKRCRIPSRLEDVRSVGEDEDPTASDVPADAVERVWQRIEAMYRTGVYPGMQVCIRRHGHVVLHRAVIHKLDEQHVLHMEDRVCDFIPEFARHGKERITIRHLLAHRAGIPNLPPEYLDLDLLTQPERIVEALCDARLRSRPGRLLAYHAVTGGFVLGEVVRRATGHDIRRVLEQHILEPLGMRWMRFGVRPEDLHLVAVDAVTGPSVPPPMSTMLRKALGVGLEEAVEICNDPRFLTGIVPSANGMATAGEAAAFYQCLLDGGELDGVRVFEPRTVTHATSEQSYWEIDLTLGFPIRYGLGFMLGSERASLFGPDNPAAFGHVGFTNTFTWADPERQIAVALLTNGKPVVSLHAIRLVQFMIEINRAFPKVAPAPGVRARRAA